MLAINAEVENPAALFRHLRTFEKKLGMDSTDIMRTAGHSIARAAMQFTQPFGLKTDAKKLGEMAIKVDVLRSLQNQPRSQASQAEAEQHQQSNRNKAGRVPDGATKIDTQAAVVDAIIAKRRLLVGKSKAAWAHAGLKIGMKRVPKWISRHPNNRAHAELGGKRRDPYVILGSNIPFASNILSPANQQKALKAGSRNALRFLARKAGIRVAEFNRKR